MMIVLSDMLKRYNPVNATLYYFPFLIDREEILNFYRLFSPGDTAKSWKFPKTTLDPECTLQRRTETSQLLWSHGMGELSAVAWHSKLCPIWDKEALLTALG